MGRWDPPANYAGPGAWGAPPREGTRQEFAGRSGGEAQIENIAASSRSSCLLFLLSVPYLDVEKLVGMVCRSSVALSV